VALLDLTNKQVQIITDSDRDESPACAERPHDPACDRDQQPRRAVGGLVRRSHQARLSITSGDVREPAWGPFIE